VLISLVGVGSAFALDALTFVASIVALLCMRPLRRAPAAGGSFVRELAAGWRYVRRHTWLWATFASAAIAYLLFMGPTEVLLPWVVKHQVGGGAGELGAVFAAGGVGSVGCAVLMGQRGLPRRDITFMYLAWTAATLAVAGYGLATAGWQLMAASLAFNALETAGTIVWATAKQRHVPAAMLGRVSSLDWLISIGLLPLSFALTGPVSAALGARTTLIGAGVLGALVTFAALLAPGMRAVEGRGEPLPAAA
jgi:DHA3 family tetracycline resistance protein-like MFS transporter